MTEAVQKVDAYDGDSGSSSMLRTYDRIKELNQQLDRLAFRYYVIAAFAIGALMFPTSNSATRISLDLISMSLFISLWGLSFMLKPLKKRLPANMQSAVVVIPKKLGLLERNEHIPKEISKEEDGLAVEKRIAKAIQDTFKTQVYSRLNNNCLMAGQNRDIDLVALFPGKQNFAISVKKRNAKAVFLHEDGFLRLVRKGHTTQMDEPCPINDLIAQEKWLRQNYPKLFQTLGSTLILPSMRVIVFGSPTVVGQRNTHKYASIGDQRVLRLERDKDFVYLLQEDQLCDFITAALKF